MLFYPALTFRGLWDADIYSFGANVKGQLTGVEFNKEHSPTWGKTFPDIATAQEFYHWMYGPFAHTAFSQNTFVGDAATNDAREPAGRILGYGSTIGGIRISQLRSSSNVCPRIPAQLVRPNRPYTCYGDSNGDFSTGTELRADFGSFKFDPTKPAAPFKFAGTYVDSWNPVPENVNVLARRDKPFSSFMNGEAKRYYPDPGFDVVFSPDMNQVDAIAAITQLEKGGYIDLHTRFIMVEFNVYNPMIDHLMWVRLMGEMNPAGGVRPTCDVEVVRMYNRHTPTDDAFLFLEIVVALFYFYYFVDEVREFRRDGWREYFGDKVRTN